MRIVTLEEHLTFPELTTQIPKDLAHGNADALLNF
jgi:hypothetical protein